MKHFLWLICILGVFGFSQLVESKVNVEPVEGRSWIRFWSDEIPDQKFVARFPEYIEVYIPLMPNSVHWEKVGSNKYKFQWCGSKEDKKRAKVDFDGILEVKEDGFEVKFRIKALSSFGARYWPWDVVCGVANHLGAHAPLFLDRKGKRTFHYFKKGFVSVYDMRKGDVKEPTGTFSFAKDIGNPKANEMIKRMAAKVSKDGKWVVAIASDKSNSVSYNLLDGTNCIHQNYSVNGMREGESFVIRLRVYLFKGTLKDLLEKYRRDFESEKSSIHWGQPVGSKSWITFYHEDLPGQIFTLRIPEVINVYIPLIAENVIWEKADGGKKLKFHWGAPKEVKEKAKADFWGEAELKEDGIDVIFNLKALSDLGPWYWMWDVVCGVSPYTKANAPLFLDREGKRTFHYFKRGFVSVYEMRGGDVKKPTGTFSFAKDLKNPKPDEMVKRIAAKVSKDGKWVIAIASDIGNSASYCLLDTANCIHQNYGVKGMRKGESFVIRLRVYLFKGTLEDLLKKCARDFGDEGKVKGKKLTFKNGIEKENSGDNFVLPAWWPATELLSLKKKIWDKRIPNIKDNLCVWIEDVNLRDKGKADRDSIFKIKGKFVKRGGFWICQENGLWVSNGKIGLWFDKKGRLQSFYDLVHKIELINSQGEDNYPFSVQILRYRKDGTTGILHFAQEGGVGPDRSMVIELNGKSANDVISRYKVGDDVLAVILNFHNIKVPNETGDMNVRVEVKMKVDEPLTYWRGECDGRLINSGLVQLRVPVIGKLGYKGENDFVFPWGSQRGVIDRKSINERHGTYPSSQWSMQLVCISFGPKVCLYAACHDAKGCVKGYRWKPGDVFYITHYVPNTGVRGTCEYSQSYDVVIGPIEGDWFTCAKLYRKWAVKNAFWARYPLRLRKDVCRRMLRVAYWVHCSYFHDDGSDGDETWNFKQSLMKVGVRESVDWFRRVLDIPDDRLGVIHYGWQKAVWDTELPFWKPFSDYVIEEIRREVSLGMSTILYTNPCWYDPKAHPFTEEVKRAIVKNIDGSMYSEKYNAKMYMINPATAYFRKVVKKLAKQINQMGSNGIYYDQFSGMIRGGDYDTKKNLPSLGKGGNWITLGKNKAIESVRKYMGADFGIVSEFYCEPHQHLFDFQSVTISSGPEEVPLIPAVYSGYIVQCGAPIDRNNSPVAGIVAMGRSFLWGTVLGGWTQFCLYLKRDYTRLLLKQIVKLRIKLEKFLVYGEMIRPPKFVEPPPIIDIGDWYVCGSKRVSGGKYWAYEASMWKDESGNRVILLVNYDKRSHKVRFNTEDIIGGEIKAGSNSYLIVYPWQERKTNLSKEILEVSMKPRSVLGVVVKQN